MHFFPSDQVFFSIGNLEIRWYAVLILTGAIITYLLSTLALRRAGYPDGVTDDLFVGCLGLGILGARLWFVLFSGDSSYITNPIRIFQLWEGGLAIHGGLIVGVAYAWFYCRKNHFTFMHLASLALPHVLLAQAMGRWGNFVNRECYGPIVDESYFNGFLKIIKSGMYIDGAYRMPMFFWESLLCVVGWILIMIYRHSGSARKEDGVYCYLAWYGAIRFWIESFRTDSLYIGPFKIAQVISVIALTVGILGLLKVFRRFTYKKPLVIFDLDGTLLDTAQAIQDSFDYVLKKHVEGIELTREDYEYFLGPTLEESFEKYAPGQDTAALLEEYRQYNREYHERGQIKPMENVPELLEYLKANGFPMTIASSKKTSMVMLGLRSCHLEGYFDEDKIIGVEKAEKHKPDPESVLKACEVMGYNPDNALYVGDSVTDMECGDRAGVYCVALVSHGRKERELNESPADKVIYDMQELKEIVEGELIK